MLDMKLSSELMKKLYEAADDIVNGRVYPFDEVFEEIEAENEKLLKE